MRWTEHRSPAHLLWRKVLRQATNKEEGILCLKLFYFQTEDAFLPKGPVSAKPGLLLSSGSCKATLVKSKTEDI